MNLSKLWEIVEDKEARRATVHGVSKNKIIRCLNTLYSDGRESPYNAGDPGLIPGSGRSHGEGNGNPLHYFCLEKSRDREAWQVTVHGVAKSQTQLSD